MDSFYDESAQYTATTQDQGNLKRPLTLDLNAMGHKAPVKKQRMNTTGSTPTVINTPDLQKFVLGTPDIETFISTLQTPTPNIPYSSATKVRALSGPLQAFANPFFVAPQATSEQEAYVRGFELALNNLKQNDLIKHKDSDATTAEGTSIAANPAITTSPPTTSAILSMNGGSITYTNLGKFLYQSICRIDKRPTDAQIPSRPRTLSRSNRAPFFRSPNVR